VTYKALSGQNPIEGRQLADFIDRLTNQGIVPLHVIAPSLPKHVSDLVRHMLNRDVELRPSLQKVQDVLRPHVAPLRLTLRDTLSSRDAQRTLPNKSTKLFSQPLTQFDSPRALAAHAPTGYFTEQSDAGEKSDADGESDS